jgi:hypothetical protein
LLLTGDKKMRLSFHGAKYEYKPVVPQVVEDNINGTYRGAPIKIHHYLKVASRHQSQDLIYRGIHYNVD